MNVEKKSDEEKNSIEEIKHWCAYQERCRKEVREKIFSLLPEITKERSEEILNQLSEENYVNEERYALAFVSGKFRIKKWGKIKIRMMLKQKQIQEPVIRNALESIEESAYLETIRSMLETKNKFLTKEKSKIQQHYKLLRFAQSRGFETDLILEILREKEK